MNSQTLALCLLLILAIAVVPVGGSASTRSDASHDDFLKRTLPKMSGHVALTIARKLGLTELMGKKFVPEKRVATIRPA